MRSFCSTFSSPCIGSVDKVRQLTHYNCVNCRIYMKGTTDGLT